MLPSFPGSFPVLSQPLVAPSVSSVEAKLLIEQVATHVVHSANPQLTEATLTDDNFKGLNAYMFLRPAHADHGFYHFVKTGLLILPRTGLLSPHIAIPARMVVPMFAAPSALPTVITSPMAHSIPAAVPRDVTMHDRSMETAVPPTRPRFDATILQQSLSTLDSSSQRVHSLGKWLVECVTDSESHSGNQSDLLVESICKHIEGSVVLGGEKALCVLYLCNELLHSCLEVATLSKLRKCLIMSLPIVLRKCAVSGAAKNATDIVALWKTRKLLEDECVDKLEAVVLRYGKRSSFVASVGLLSDVTLELKREGTGIVYAPIPFEKLLQRVAVDEMHNTELTTVEVIQSFNQFKDSLQNDGLL